MGARDSRIASSVRRALIAAAKATPLFVAIDASGCSKSSSCVGQVACAAEAGGASMIGCAAQVTGGATMDCAATPCAAIAGGPPFGTGGVAGTGGHVGAGGWGNGGACAIGGRVGTGGLVSRDGGRDRWVPDATTDASSGADIDGGDRDR